jgi:hypothetical protein
MLTMRCCLPRGENPAEAEVILRAEMFAKEKPLKSAQNRKPAALLCALFMAALLSFTWEAQGAFIQGDLWSVLAACQDNHAFHKGRQGHIRRSPTVKKRHPRSRKATTRHHRLRAKRAQAKVAKRRGVPPTYRHARHPRHKRYYVRKGSAPRASSARIARTQARKTQAPAACGAKPAARRPPVVGPEAKQSFKAAAPAKGAPEQAPVRIAGARQDVAVEVDSDGMISANVKDRPLGEMLRLMVEKHLFEIQGPLPRSALSIPVSMAFSGLTLNQIFNKMMRGYNYAVITEEVSDRRVLIVLGEIKRVEYRELVAPVQPPRRHERAARQSAVGAPVAAAAQGAGGVPEGIGAAAARRATIQSRLGRPNGEGLSAPPGPVEGGETSQTPVQEQIGQERQGLVRPGTGAESGAAATPPKTEGGSTLPEERPPDRSTLGSF